jgi:hypothetical protein
LNGPPRWRVIEGVFPVLACPGLDPPPPADVAARNHGDWYSIDDRDQASRTTFARVIRFRRKAFA